MLTHPFTESIPRKVAGIVLTTISAVVQCILLVVYSDAQFWPAAVDSLLSAVLLSAAGYLVWYAINFIHMWHLHILLALLVQFVCTGICFMLLMLAELADTDVFIHCLPLRLLFGILAWIILLQWYWMLQKTDRLETELAEKAIEADKAYFDTGVLLDRISVKDGTHIHIIHIKELQCLQANGDYVLLYTSAGQYIKEQTMKYFETNLPPTFVRIHRSVIVNTEYIQRIELFGKEIYNIKLKNGQNLRASSAGYKLLKERLSL